MKIVYCLIDASRIGGMERVVCGKANYLVEKLGYDVHIVTTDQGEKKSHFPFSKKIIFHDLGINYFELEQLSPLSRIIKQIGKRQKHRQSLKRLLMELRADIVISTYTHEFTLLCNIKDDQSKKIAEIHFSKEYNKVDNKIKKQPIISKAISILAEKRKHFYISRYDKFVVLTKKDQENWTKPDNVEQIYNMVPFSTHQVSSLKNKRVISVGRLSSEKGFDLLIDAWVIVSEQYPDWTLDIFGEGSEYDRLCVKISEEKLSESVRINTPTQDIVTEYLNSSIFVLSSRHEGFGMVLLEAMSCGIPCISFNCPNGPQEIIRDREDGFLVKNESIHELAEKIKLLIVDESLRKEMGVEAKKNVERFSPDSIMKEWDTLFKSLVE